MSQPFPIPPIFHNRVIIIPLPIFSGIYPLNNLPSFMQLTISFHCIANCLQRRLTFIVDISIENVGVGRMVLVVGNAEHIVFGTDVVLY